MLLQSFIFYWVIVGFYWIDILLRTRTTYIASDFSEVTSAKKIMIRYVTSFKFYYHLASSFPLLPFSYLIGDGSFNRLLMGNLFIRLLDLNLVKMEAILPVPAKKIWRLIMTMTKFILIVSKYFDCYLMMGLLDTLDLLHLVRGSVALICWEIRRNRNLDSSPD